MRGEGVHAHGHPDAAEVSRSKRHLKETCILVLPPSTQTQTHSHSVFLLRQCVHDGNLRVLIIPLSPAPSSFLMTESSPLCCFPHFLPLHSFPIRSRSPLTWATTEPPRCSAFTLLLVRCFQTYRSMQLVSSPRPTSRFCHLSCHTALYISLYFSAVSTRV